ncbi:MAG TPA: alpha amylase N-terminal ig-like domain-containing protein [Halanaerobiales bacterium]|nr:alpha amylase N-terminal ig-like domain-containing protein [Halanaerobiales bacterium]
MKKYYRGLIYLILILLICSLSITAAPPGMKDVTFKYEPQIDEVVSVYLAGSFNNWATKKIEMTDENGDGVYEITISLKPGTYEYKLVVNGSMWKKDPHSEDYAPDGFGGLNSVINVGQQIKKVGKVGDGEIIKSALWHEQEIPAHITRLGNNIIEIRFQTAVNDVEDVRLNFFDEDGYQVEYMNYFTSDEQFDYWTKRIEVKDNEFRYRFVVDDAETRFWFGREGLANTMADWFRYNKENYPLFKVPAWVKEAVFYQIFPERFYNGNPDNDPEYIETYKNKTERYENIGPGWYQGVKESEHHYIDPVKFMNKSREINPKSGWHVLYGGDFQGIMEKIDYLKELGINAVYFNPVFEATSNHKYNTIGYEFIEDNFAVKGNQAASNKLFIQLIENFHAEGIKVVLDGVFNHTGYEHYAFQDVIENGKDSKYWDWYYINSYPIVTLYEQRTANKQPNYESWAGFGSLPKLNVNNEEVKEYIYEITKKWMDPNGDGNPADGIDGWRLDVANEVKDRNPEFWQNWRDYMKEINPDAYITGEIWGDAGEYLKGNEFDGVMNYRFRDAVVNLLIDNWGVDKFINEINKVKAEYPEPAYNSLLNLIDSHDTERFLNTVGNNKKKLKTAAFLQFVMPGAPMVYYGDEVGIEGASDPDNRRTMLWEESANPYQLDKGLLRFYKQLIEIRKENEVLIEGSLNISSAGDNGSILLINRELAGEKIVGLINTSSKKREIKFQLNKEEVVDLISQNSYSLKDGELSVMVDSHGLYLFK